MCKYFTSLAVLLVFLTSCSKDESNVSSQHVTQLRYSMPLSIHYLDESSNLQIQNCEKVKVIYVNSFISHVVLYNGVDSISFRTNALTIDPDVESIDISVYNQGSNSVYTTNSGVNIEAKQASISSVINGNVVNGGVFISDSPLLSECDVASICAYIAVENNSPTFSQNATGCNSELQVENACLGILPLEWLSFEVAKKSDNVLLIWQTQHEVNNDYFEVEKSQDGLLFTPIAKIVASNAQTTSFQYQYSDNTLGYGTVYYRIKQVDFDGRFSYSKIIAVPMTISNTMLYPNPSADIIYVRSDKTIDHFVIKDIFGKVQISGTAFNSSIDISSLTNGIYIIEIDTQKFFFTKI